MVILAKTASIYHFEMTQRAIDTLRCCEPDVRFRVVLVETQNSTGRDYAGVDTLVEPGGEFNYNRFLNAGVSVCQSARVVLSNNDVMFHPLWYSHVCYAMDNHGADSASAKCPRWGPHRHFSGEVVLGWQTGVHFCGWNLTLSRAVVDSVFPLDERFKFWYQDNDMATSMERAGFKHALASSALVTHLESMSHELIDPVDLYNWTHGQHAEYDAKWNSRT